MYAPGVVENLEDILGSQQDRKRTRPNSMMVPVDGYRDSGAAIYEDYKEDCLSDQGAEQPYRRDPLR